MPTDSKFISFHRPAIGEDEIQSVVETLTSGWLTTGPKVKRFEKVLRGMSALPVNSGTAALHLALDTVEIGEGDGGHYSHNDFRRNGRSRSLL